MKNLYITLSFMLAATVVMAQHKDTEAADKLYARFEFVEAAAAYQKIEKKNPYIYKRIAESHYHVFNSGEAVKWYAKATETPQEAEVYWHFAQMLKAEGRYADATIQLKKFASLAPGDPRAVAFNKEPDYLPKLRNQAKLFEEKVLDINHEKYGSFGAVLSDDRTLYFTSSRNTLRSNYAWTEEPFLDLYSAAYHTDGTYSAPEPIKEINSKYHDGPATVTADGTTMYFASESFNEQKGYQRDKQHNLKVGQVWLFRAKKEKGKWGSIVAVPFNDKSWSTGNPSVSRDGKTLYFSSDRPGSLGGSDIWKVEVDGEHYGAPVNLGPAVNTSGRESFPFITDDNLLYFSSDGRKGFGSLDVFRIDLKGGSEALNIGAPVNGAKDDFAFSFNTLLNLGHFSSNRDGIDKIYSAVPVCGVEAIIQVRDKKTLEPLAGAQVAVLDEKHNTIETRTADASGRVIYNVDCDRAYGLQGSMEMYRNATASIPATKGGPTKVFADLDPIEVIVTPTEVVLNALYFEFDKSNIGREAAFELDKLVEAMKANPELVILVGAHTDSRGSADYNSALSDRRAKSAVQYVISRGISKTRISGQGHGEGQPKVDCGEECSEAQHAQNRRVEYKIVKSNT